MLGVTREAGDSGGVVVLTPLKIACKCAYVLVVRFGINLNTFLILISYFESITVTPALRARFHPPLPAPKSLKASIGFARKAALKAQRRNDTVQLSGLCSLL